MVINENHIKNIVSEALSSLLLELDMGVIGGAGPLTASDMEDPSKIFEQEYNTLNSLKNGGKGAKVEKIFGETKAYKVWKNYYDAMMSKKGSFNFMRPSCFYGQQPRAFLSTAIP